MDKILVPVSITPVATSWDEVLKQVADGRHKANTCFSALLDTGCNHHFSIRQEDLKEFTTLNPNDLGPPRESPVNEISTPFHDASLWIHYNASYGSADLSKEPPFHIELSRGIAVHRLGEKKDYWLPILGLRALEAGKLKVHIDCEKGLLTLGT